MKNISRLVKIKELLMTNLTEVNDMAAEFLNELENDSITPNRVSKAFMKAHFKSRSSSPR